MSQLEKHDPNNTNCMCTVDAGNRIMEYMLSVENNRIHYLDKK